MIDLIPVKLLCYADNRLILHGAAYWRIEGWLCESHMKREDKEWYEKVKRASEELIIFRKRQRLLGIENRDMGSKVINAIKVDKPEKGIWSGYT